MNAVQQTFLQSLLERSWYQKPSLLSYLLWPLSVIYGAVMIVRRLAYRLGVLKSYRSDIPVIVVGNLTVGGTGKTPLVIYLIEALRSEGFTPGVISRGYAGQAQTYPLIVRAQTPVQECGDEPALIVKRTDVPMVVGPNRQHSIEHLQSHFDVDVIISDDGLQHLALQRDIEICVQEPVRVCKNKMLLPAGPYRESASRVSKVDFIVNNGASVPEGEGLNAFTMQLEPQQPVPLISQQGGSFDENTFSQGVHAMAGIGNPKRFFTTCEQLGWQIQAHVFPDHHTYRAGDLDFGDSRPVVMTEKDAVKCAQLADQRHWFLPVNAKLKPNLAQQIIKRLRTHD